jgi:hypothetical protein
LPVHRGREAQLKLEQDQIFDQGAPDANARAPEWDGGTQLIFTLRSEHAVC